jgi:hypothetical protein
MSIYENIILGCGPAAIQCGYFFEKYNIPYIIIEKNSECASFFSSYPLSGKLISVNKKYTGSKNKEFNLRHDWNSLLTDDDDFRFTEYSEDYYPKREDLHKYLNDFAKRYKLKIAFNTNVKRISKSSEGYYTLFLTDGSKLYTCKKLIVATGLSKMNIPKIKMNVVDKIKHYGEYSKDYFIKKENLNDFKNKKVMLFGSGNASYELANIINEVSSSVTIIGNRRNWALSSNYSGDIRSIYLPFMDTFLLKSLNAINYLTDKNYEINIAQKTSGDLYEINCPYYYSQEKNGFDKIIFCTGWAFDDSIFDFSIELTKNGRYPKINDNFESPSNESLYFIGSLLHSLDFRKSAGGFISGFRFLIKNFIHMNYNIEFDNKLFYLKTIDDVEILTKHIVYKINNSPAMYQMFGSIGDILYFNREKGELLYYNDVLINRKSLNKFLPKEIVYFKIILDYGEMVTNINELGNKKSDIGNEGDSNLIHPIIIVYNNIHDEIDIIHLDESLYSEYNAPNKYYNRIVRLFKSYM